MALHEFTVSSVYARSVILIASVFCLGGCATVERHACAGLNDCKGLGGCRSGDNGCAGKNSCSGKGGCAVPIRH